MIDRTARTPPMVPGSRSLVLGAIAALVLSLGARELFTLAGWPGRNIAQWVVFYALAWRTSSWGQTRLVWTGKFLVWGSAAAVTIWLLS